MDKGTERQLVIDMDAVARQAAGLPRPQFYYASESQQTRYDCEQCGEFNDIRGRYGYCVACGHRNNAQLLKAAFDGLRERLNNGHVSPQEAVRSAIAEFDASCRDMTLQVAKRIPMKAGRRFELEKCLFHDLESSTVFGLKQMFEINLLRGIDNDLKFVKMMVERRHVFEHNGGVVDERYLRLSGDSDGKIGVIIRETRDNAHRLIGILMRMAQNYHRDFHEIFVPTEWPVKHHRAMQERRKQRATPNP